MTARSATRLLLGIALPLWLLAAGDVRADHREVRIGVQVQGEGQPTLDRFAPLISHLNNRVPGHAFELVALSRDNLLTTVDNSALLLDFVITDPGLYAVLEVEHGVTRIATMVRHFDGLALNTVAAALFTRGDRIDINHVEDLEGARLAAFDEHAFEGWYLARHMLLAGDLEFGADYTAEFHGYDAGAVIEAVLEGRADAGVLPAGHLEELRDSGHVARERLKVIEPRQTAFFPVAHSTALYPEWPIAKLKHTPDDLARKVVVALLDIRAEEVQIPEGEIEWTTPLDYQPVHALLRTIGAPPYAGFDRLTIASLVDDYGHWIAVSALVLLLMLGTTVYTLYLNRRLIRSEQLLRDENRERRQAEEALGRYGDELEERIRSRTAELEYLAHYDDLTGLPNRNLLFENLDRVIQNSQKESSTFALLMIGLDRIREINNTLGHYFGDMILQQAADVLVKRLKEAETVARSGDDVFVVVLARAGQSRAEEVAHEIHEALDRTFFLDGHPLHMKAQVGVTVFPEHGLDADTLMRHADVALHSVRRTRMEYSVYDPSLNKHGLRDLKLLGDLRNALNSEDQLMLHFQPKVCLKERRLSGVECLIRWNHPQMGLVSPELFVPLAEKTGLIRPLTLWVLNAAFNQVSRWQEMGLDVVSAINLSAWNLQDRHLLGQIRELLDAWSIHPSRIEMEVTESAMMDDPERVLALLRELSQMGIRLAIDDFGTGYSSMSYLKRLPVDEVKIDKSFVLDLDSNAEDRAIVKATIDLAHSLGLEVIAEGVDSQEAIDLLIEMGCDTAQGYFIARPQSALDLLKWHVESPWGQALYRRGEAAPSPLTGNAEPDRAPERGPKSFH
ncbi:MAG: EAL domain-containing protein [Gammaproteobacteria bacterium]|nr:EAL domain-containing protein [Gammaproteobacteria bacterium]